MALAQGRWKDLPAELAPTAGETLAEHNARIAAYDLANPDVLTFLSAAALEDVEARAEAEIAPVRADVAVTREAPLSIELPEYAQLVVGGDYTAAITAALTYAATAIGGAGEVFLPPGQLNLTATAGILAGSAATNPVALDIPDNVTLSGVRGRTILRHNAGTDALLMILLRGASKATVRNLILDGRYGELSHAGHTVWWEDGGSDCLLEWLEIKNSGSYGIGMQYGTAVDQSALIYRRNALRHLHIHDCGADAIDIKNQSRLNEGQILEHITVERWGRRATLVGQAGVDVRGQANLFGIVAKDFGDIASSEAIRFRGAGEATPSHGSADRSTLTGFEIVGKDLAGSNGLAIYADKGVKVSQGVVTDCDTGMVITPQAGSPAQRHTVSDVDAVSCPTYGFHIAGGSPNNQHKLIGCNADGAGVAAFRLDNNEAMVIGCGAYNSAIGVSLPSSTPTDNVIVGMQFAGNTTDYSENAAAIRTRVLASQPSAMRSVASAATITLTGETTVYNVTGTTTITKVTASWAGRLVVLRFAAACAVTDAPNLYLAGSFTATQYGTLTLVCDGTNWYEVSRSMN